MKYFFLLLGCSFFANAVIAQNNPPLTKPGKIYIVRHAEKLKGDDPLLTEEGNKRAGDLMRVLKNNNPVKTHEHYKDGEDQLPKNVL